MQTYEYSNSITCQFEQDANEEFFLALLTINPTSSGLYNTMKEYTVNKCGLELKFGAETVLRQ